MSLSRNELSQKFYVCRSFFFSFLVSKPWFIVSKIEVDDGVKARIKESFKNELSCVVIFIITEILHVESLYLRIVLKDLSE